MNQRKGPYPLLAHLGMLMSSSIDLRSVVQEHAAPYFSPVKALELEEVIRGIKMYMEHPYKAQQQTGVRIWKKGSVTVNELYGTEVHKVAGQAVLLVPSLINTSAIFDLCAERSIASFLHNKGHNVYILDWGNTAKDDPALDLSATITERLLPAIQETASHAQGPVTVLGYCMGGTLSLAAASCAAQDVSKLILLAAPWDFRAGRNRLSDRVREWAPMVMPQLEQKGHLPADWTQTLFATLDPEGAAKKFARFARMDQESLEARLFVAVEDWLNEGVDLAPQIARDVLQQWFALNAPAKGEWSIGENNVDLSSVKAEIMLVASQKDQLVPFEAANAVALSIPKEHLKTLRLNSGHIGLIAGRNAVEKVWSPIAEWLAQ